MSINARPVALDNDSAEILQLAVSFSQNAQRGYCSSADILGAMSMHDVGRQLLIQRGASDEFLNMISGMAATFDIVEEASGVISLPAHEILALAESRGALRGRPISADLMLTAMSEVDSAAKEMLVRLGISEPVLPDLSEDFAMPGNAPGRSIPDTPTLDSISTDLTQMAADGEIDPVIGRDEEIRQLVEIASRRNKNNAAIIGEAGVGKTALAEGLAQAIVDGQAPALANHRLLALDTNKLLAGAAGRGMLEERLAQLVDEVEKSKAELIIFIDEAHSIAGPETAGNGLPGIGDILKPALARGKFRVVAATTFAEYRMIERDAALARRFSPIKLKEPSGADLKDILNGVKERYETFHGVSFSDDAIAACIDLSTRYMSTGNQPDKALDLLDTSAAKVKISKASEMAELKERFVQLRPGAPDMEEELAKIKEGMDSAGNTVTPDIVALCVSERTQIPVGALLEDERSLMLGIEDRLKERIVGHEEVIHSVSEALKAARAGIRDEQKPIGTFLFCGPTGVGKTEMAKAISQDVFGSEDALVRIDMSEYHSPHAISRLIGAPPGYVGYGRGGALTEAVYQRPYSVVLFDEIEKAHPDVTNSLLQVLDDGRLTDGEGKVVDFTNTIVIMTTNAGAATAERRSPGFTSSTEPEARIKEALKGSFAPEFLNRIDVLAVFESLDEEQVVAVAEMICKRIQDRVASQGYTLNIKPEVLEHLSEKGYSRLQGARQMMRVLRQALEGPISTLILDPTTRPGATFTAHLNAAGEVKLRRRNKS